MKKRSLLMIAVLLLFSFNLFCLNDMGKGGSYDGYTSISGSVDFTAIFFVNFISSTTEAYIGEEIQFTDISAGSPTTWEWDMENDGNYDYFIQNPIHIYNTVGTFSVKLKISNATMVDSLVQENLITVSYIPPAEPQNVQVNIVYPDAIISWSAVDTTIFGDPINVDAYLVYYCGSPDSVYYFHGLTINTTYTHQYIAQFSNNMFYQVTAYVGDLRMLQNVITEYPYLRLGEIDLIIERYKRLRKTE